MQPLRLSDLQLVDASVLRTATFQEAARALCESGLSAIAVLGADAEVAGLFTEDDFLAGLFPRYLAELKHTAFVTEEIEVLLRRARVRAAEPIEKHMRKPITLDAGSSTLHAAEIFLHCEWGAVAVVSQKRFVGMLAQTRFCKELLPALER